VRYGPTKLTAVLVLWCAACGRVDRYAHGFVLDVANAPQGCGDGRHIVAVAVGKHRVRLNAEPDMTVSEVGPRVREILKTRAERIAFVQAEAHVSWGELVELVDHIRPEVEVISLITPQVDWLARQRMCLAPSCGRCAELRKFGSIRP